MNPKVSVIIPVYNVEKCLRNCLDSVINQTLKDIEIICVNDGSPDNSLGILKEYAQNDKRIKIINQENKGVSAARNAGLECATGEYIQFVDADDYINLDLIQRAYEKIKITKTDILCFGSQDSDKGKFVVNPLINFFNYIDITNNSYVTEKIDKTRLIHSIWDKLYKRDFLNRCKIRFPAGVYATEDGIFNLYCLFKDATFSVLNYVGYTRVNTGESTTSDIYKILGKSINAIKYVLESDVYLNADENSKILILEKMLGSLLYYYSFTKNLKEKIFYVRNIEQFRKYLDNKVDSSTAQKVSCYNRLRMFDIKRFILNNLFSCKNEYCGFVCRKQICIFGLKITFKQNFKKQNQVQKYLVKNYIKPYIAQKSDKYNILPKKQNLCGEKIIWQYWGQGVDEKTPKIVQACLNSVNKCCGDYKQIILTNDNISEYIDIPDYVLKKLATRQITYAFFSDILRLCLLAAYGGIWIDATILLTGQIPEKIIDTNFFTFQRTNKSRYQNEFKKFNSAYFNWSKKCKVNWLSSFIKAEKDYPLIVALRDIVLNYSKKENKLHHYFLVHLIFDYLVKNTSYKKYNCEMADDTIPHLMQLNFNKQYSDKLWNDILSKCTIHKLTYTNELGTGSVGEHILEGKFINDESINNYTCV